MTKYSLQEKLKQDYYDFLGLEITDFSLETESKEYEACRYNINDAKYISRKAKITPKKNGQFVTFWKRFNNGPIEPFNETDDFEYFVIHIETAENRGQFVFPKSTLIKRGLISTSAKEGKRGFRVYPSWDTPTSSQAINAQKWQLEYFFTIDNNTDASIVSKIYEKHH